MEDQSTPQQLQIKILTINGRKLTKSLFSQLEIYDCLDSQLEFRGDQILGFVNAGDKRFLLWTKNGFLRKTNLEPYYKILRASSDTFVINIQWFLTLTGIEFYEHSSRAGRIADLDDIYKEKLSKLTQFLRSIKPEMQLFL